MMVAGRFQPQLAEMPPQGPLTAPRPPRRLRDAIEPPARHAVWSRLTTERLAAFGLSFFEAYVWGRAAALGEPPADLVVAIFVFEPARLAGAYEAARRRVGRTELLEARSQATSASPGRSWATAPVRSASPHSGLDWRRST